MNAASGLNMKVGRFSKFAVRAGVLGMGLLVLVGCKNQQHEDQVTQLNSEVTSLKEEKAQLEATNNSLQAQLAARPVTPPPAAPQSGDQGWGSDTGANNRPIRPAQRDVVIEVAGDVLFASGQVTLGASGKKELDKVATTIKNKYSGHDIRIEGYTDTDPIRKAKFSSNEALSKARAEAVENYLSSKGVNNSMSTVGRGAAKPRATKAASRRVEIVILGNR
ncbi:MAG: OmpA family protein [Pyrinomonadaceae bacterium]|nr:OmpA family protein [Phycisphaerales bacterium]